MTIRDPARSKAMRAVSKTLRRTCEAFGLDRERFSIELVPSSEHRMNITLTYGAGDDQEPMVQVRELHRLPGVTSLSAAEARDATEEMARNVALAFRPTHPVRPTGWSTHPAAASIVAAAGTELPNPADPASWLRRARGEIHLPDGGHITDAVFIGKEGVLLLARASIVDARGYIRAIVRMDGPRMVVTVPNTYPETFADALLGRPAEALLSGLAPDRPGGGAPIVSATNLPEASARLVVELADRLVPLLPSTEGGEQWRPWTAKEIGGLPPERFDHLLLGHSSTAVARRYYQTAGQRRLTAAGGGQARPSLPTGRDQNAAKGMQQ